MFSNLCLIHQLCLEENIVINKENIEKVVNFNRDYLPEVKSKIEMLKSSGDPLIASKPLEFIKTYLYENARVLEFPIKNSDYGGLVFYYNQDFYIQINTAQPKIYENFMWAHEFYHFYFDKDKVKKKEENLVQIDSIFDEKERLPNLFAGELLINDHILNRKYTSLKKDNSLSLADIAVHLIPVFEVPYKAIVIKLAQNQFITIDKAKDIIDYDYKNNLPDEIDRTLFAASNKIKIDDYKNLISKAENNLNEEDYQSIINKYKKLYQLVLDWRKELAGESENEGYRKS